MGLRVTVLGSFGDLDHVENICKMLKDHGFDVVQPSPEHLELARPKAKMRNVGNSPMFLTRLGTMEDEYLNAINASDVVFVANMKRDNEYIGTSVSFEIGYALHAGKLIVFEMKPSDAQFNQLVHHGRATLW